MCNIQNLAIKPTTQGAQEQVVIATKPVLFRTKI
jgi:hypothetical protein